MDNLNYHDKTETWARNYNASLKLSIDFSRCEKQRFKLIKIKIVSFFQ